MQSIMTPLPVSIATGGTMSQQVVISHPHDERESLRVRETPFHATTLKGLAALALAVVLFGSFMVIFRSILPFSLLWPYMGRFDVIMVRVALSATFTILTVTSLAAIGRILRETLHTWGFVST